VGWGGGVGPGWAGQSCHLSWKPCEFDFLGPTAFDRWVSLGR
jgi:hypothetical protein